jgi:hypothetical protein
MSELVITEEIATDLQVFFSYIIGYLDWQSEIGSSVQSRKQEKLPLL